MSKYLESEVINCLHKKGIRFKDSSKVIDVKSGSIGLKLLGMLDFLEKECNYTIRYSKGE